MQNYEDVRIKKVEVVKITPQIAESMLSKNEGNRKISPATVFSYSEDMKNGRWRSTHQGIAVDESGKIIDGQHRLSAIIKSGFSMVTTLTVYDGKLDTIFIPIDRGKNRSLNDLTRLTKSESSLVSTISYFFSSLGGKSKLDPVTALSIHSEIIEEIKYLCEVTGVSIDTSSGVSRRSMKTGIARVWTAPFKTALLVGIFENIDISTVKDFKNEVPKNKHFREYLEWSTENMVTGGSGSIIITSMVWSILKYKKFIFPNNFDEIDRCKSEIRKIIKKRFPEIFGNN